MKRLFYFFALIITLMLSSCVTDAQVTYSEYYDYNNRYTVVYINEIPYYRIWEDFHWIYRAVPRERLPYIRINPRYRQHEPFHPRPMQPNRPMNTRPPMMNNHKPPMSNHNPSIMNRGGQNSHPQMNRGGSMQHQRGGSMNGGHQGQRGGGRR